jgi:mannitol/fructose-specific phosphotransferase system IIA component (Ntr-type)
VRAADLIAAGGVLLRPPCGSFEDAVTGLVDTLIANSRLSSAVRERAVHAVVGREALASTAIVEIGVAVPHARVEGVDGVVAALAASPGGLYYAMANVPISVMVIVLSAPELIGEHLNTLAGVSLLLQSAAVRRGLEHAADSETALRLLRGGNGRA